MGLLYKLLIITFFMALRRAIKRLLNAWLQRLRCRRALYWSDDHTHYGREIWGWFDIMWHWQEQHKKLQSAI